MSRRSDAKAVEQWETATRQWAHERARTLVFELTRYRQVSPTPYGLGLVLEPGETIWVEDTDGPGSRVSFTLPVALQPAPVP